MLDILLKFLPAVTANDIYVFCRDHWFVATIAAYVLLTIIGVIVASSIMEFVHRLVHVAWSPLVKTAVVLLGLLGLPLSAIVVLIVLRQLEPIPVFNEGQRNFIREPVVLNWTFTALNGDKPVVYEVESAAKSDFSKNSTVTYDGNSLYSYQEEGTRWWRVRTKIAENGRTGSWSKPIQTTYYPSSYSRIKKRREMLVYVSNEVTQGIFKFLNDRGVLTGVEIDLSRRIAKTLSTDLQDTIRPRFVPIQWAPLLKQPAAGTADIIVSSISRLQSRERDFQIKFSEAYFCTRQALVYRKNEWAADLPIRKMLKGMALAYEENSTGEKLVNNLVKDYKSDDIRGQPFAESESMFQSLMAPNSNTHLVIIDTTLAVERLMHDDAGNLAFKPFSDSDYPPSAKADERQDVYAIAVAQGETELLAAINKTIAAMRADKSLDGLLKAAAQAKYPTFAPEKLAPLVTSSCPI